jgi:hypothetical protein
VPHTAPPRCAAAAAAGGLLTRVCVCIDQYWEKPPKRAHNIFIPHFLCEIAPKPILKKIFERAAASQTHIQNTQMGRGTSFLAHFSKGRRTKQCWESHKRFVACHMQHFIHSLRFLFALFAPRLVLCFIIYNCGLIEKEDSRCQSGLPFTLFTLSISFLTVLRAAFFPPFVGEDIFSLPGNH